MLTQVLVAAEASYSAEGQTLRNCKPVNYVFSANGAGKTTISRVIAAPSRYSACRLTWKDGREMERLVFKGIFEKTRHLPHYEMMIGGKPLPTGI